MYSNYNAILIRVKYEIEIKRREINFALELARYATFLLSAGG